MIFIPQSNVYFTAHCIQQLIVQVHLIKCTAVYYLIPNISTCCCQLPKLIVNVLAEMGAKGKVPKIADCEVCSISKQKRQQHKVRRRVKPGTLTMKSFLTMLEDQGLSNPGQEFYVDLIGHISPL